MTDHGATPLANSRMEKFALALSKGRSQGQAYADAIPPGQAHSLDPRTLRVSGHRWAKRPDVTLRVAFLRLEAAGEIESIPDVLTSGDVIALSLEVSELLQECYQVSKTLGVVSQPKLEQLRKTLASHLSRQQSLSPQNEKQAPADSDEMAHVLDRIHDFGGCTCQN